MMPNQSCIGGYIIWLLRRAINIIQLSQEVPVFLRSLNATNRTCEPKCPNKGEDFATWMVVGREALGCLER